MFAGLFPRTFLQELHFNFTTTTTKTIRSSWWKQNKRRNPKFTLGTVVICRLGMSRRTQILGNAFFCPGPHVFIQLSGCGLTQTFQQLGRVCTFRVTTQMRGRRSCPTELLEGFSGNFCFSGFSFFIFFSFSHHKILVTEFSSSYPVIVTVIMLWWLVHAAVGKAQFLTSRKGKRDLGMGGGEAAKTQGKGKGWLVSMENCSKRGRERGGRK